MTILGGDYKLVKVEVLDLVGYIGGGEFVILNPHRSEMRKLPAISKNAQAIPWCFQCKIENNQVVNFNGNVATLHDIAGEWHFKLREENSKLMPLPLYSFFEIGDYK